jgi:hypothetical protein
MKTFKVKIEVLLDPVGTPDVTVTCNNQIQELIVTKPTWISFEFVSLSSECELIVEHRNRHPHDGITAVIVKSIVLNGIASPKAIYRGVYYPQNQERIIENYLSWNGVWILSFSVPVYTWIHQVENLGWIYD